MSLEPVIALLLVTAIGLLIALLLRRGGDPALIARIEALDRALERVERGTREELAASRRELLEDAQRQRAELAGAADNAREEQATSVRELGEALGTRVSDLGNAQKERLETLSARLGSLVESNDTRLAAIETRLTERLERLTAAVEGKLQEIRSDNESRLEQLRATVEEKLQGTLETRLGESFRTVSAQLEQVHKGLGEMQALAAGVGDLKRVLSNVKTRGTFGEVQLEAILEQVLTPDQLERNVATRKGSSERVEFAIRLPGREPDSGAPVLLPLDAKFPLETYQRLQDAAERADAPALETLGRQLEREALACATDIHDKYLDPPSTTDFAVMFLPTEGLYAEVLRRPGLVERLQRGCGVVLAGPTTLLALLNSLQMGFRTLAIERRSSEVWRVLGAIKTEFGKFGTVLEKVQKKLQEASNTIDDADRRRRAMDRKLREVEALPADESARLLPVDTELVDV